jgi:hypothetical protein
MGLVVQREAAAARAAQASSASLPTATPGRTEPIPPRELVPVYRELDPGEQRLEGTLERIECLAGGAAVFHLRTVDGPARANAPQIAKVDFTSYRDDVPDSIGCGALKPPLPVYLTWRPDARKPETKIAVAVEFRH